MSRRTQTVWIRSEWAFVFQTHCNRHRTPLVESCAVCFVEDPLLPITSLPASTGWLALASCWKCGSSLLFCDPESSASSMVVEIIGLESAILTTVAGNPPNPRWAGRLCAKAFTEKLRILMQRLTATTDDRVPLFVRIADADPRLRHYLFGRQRPGMRIERLSWYWRFLLMIVLVRQLNSREETGAFYDLRVLTQLWCSPGTCGTFAGIDDKSVISRKPLLRFEQADASPRVQDGPGLDHGSSRSELCCLSWLPIHLTLAP